VRLAEPLKRQVKDAGLWAAHLDPELGGQGFGQIKLALMHEILGMTDFAPLVFGCPGAGFRQLGADRHRRHACTEGAVADAAARR
jgi:alkylation response protein AidB-like acyl-CoA dehydrogenase